MYQLLFVLPIHNANCMCTVYHAYAIHSFIDATAI